jgi:zinc transporter 2
MGTLLSLFVIWGMTAYLLDIAITRLLCPHEHKVIGKIMFIIACFSTVFNVIQISILHSGDLESLSDHRHSHSHGGDHGHGNHGHSHGENEDECLKEKLVEVPEHNCGIENITKKVCNEEHNMNVHAAYLHILGDLLNSIGVVTASALIYADPSLWWLDPCCTIFFSFIVLYTTRSTFMQCVYILMECAPVGMDIELLEKQLCKVRGVEEIHDMHVWSISKGKHVSTCHVKCKKEDHTYVIAQMNRVLRSEAFKISHNVI